jgi:hypothetical protein
MPVIILPNGEDPPKTRKIFAGTSERPDINPYKEAA